MKATYIDYSETNSFSKTLIAYLNQDEALVPLSGIGQLSLVLKSKLMKKNLFLRVRF
ncbi:hypothetical protein [Sphingobacterium sp. IITKGP-BTPF85]|uniref:hypothetical protein n=1 Tax=Sphingobacterium sp. IITKGP-BTPF85 TaxID=1338009 RepID=UPI00038A3D0B|nr:hypothetical protein [Sphingobacterium sp. IITKGP-BTPF85]KKX49723.1 hypothetical protein L950_0213965 [Sphingobacterium sp. IITKGP-BTPF85]